jgi:hypothetical protein
MQNLFILKVTWKGTLRQLIICMRPTPLLGFDLGWSSNFVGSEFGHCILSISNATLPPPSSPLVAQYLHLLIHRETSGEGVLNRRKCR